MADPFLLRRAALVSALCLKRLDGMKIQVRRCHQRHEIMWGEQFLENAYGMVHSIVNASVTTLVAGK